MSAADPGRSPRCWPNGWGAAAVTAVDPSAPFVEAARERLPGISVTKASAESLPFEDATFDRTLAQLVVHFMSDPARGVGELRRVTRAGGVVAASVWDFEGGRAPQSTFFRALLTVMPDADDEVARAGARRGELAALLEQAGCRDIEQTELEVTVTSPTFEDWWQPYTLGVGPAGAQFARLDIERQRAVQERCRELLGDGPILSTATAWAVKGRR